MKERGVQRSVRPQRFDRAAGDAPSLGRVARVPGTGLPKDVQRKRRSEGRSHRRGGQENHGRGNAIITWSLVLVVIVLGVLGAFIWAWLKPNMNRKPGPVVVETAPLALKHNVSQFESPSEDHALDLVKQALALRDAAGVERFFRPGSAQPADVISFLQNMEVLDGAVTGYQWLSSMDANGLLLDGVLVSTAKDGAPRNRLALLTPDEAGVWKIDFDAFARTVKPSWSGLMAEGRAQGLLRVIVAKDSYYNGPFRDEAEWLSYGMASPDSELILLGYCRKGSSQARAMERIISEEKEGAERRLNRVTLEVLRPEGAEARQFEITRVLAEDWVLGGKPFDEEFQ